MSKASDPVTQSIGGNEAALPSPATILITDNVLSDATFLLTHWIAKALKHKISVVLVGCSQPLDHYMGILRKTGIQLQAEITRGTFVFVDAQETQDLGELYTQHFTETCNSLVLLDDLTSLVWRGISPEKVVEFYTALQVQPRLTLVSRIHGDDLAVSSLHPDSLLFRRCLQLADVWIEVVTLASQRGELTLHKAPGLAHRPFTVTPREGNLALQYKIDELGPTFFAKGTTHFF